MHTTHNQSPVRLLCSDLDGTLLGDAPALARFARLWAALPRPARPLLVYNTGRTVADVLFLLQRSALPQPDFIIGSVGTEIFDAGRRVFRHERLPELDRCWCPNTAHRCALELPGIKSQGPENQSPWKRSYWWNRPPEGGLGLLRSRLASAGLDAKVVFSGGCDLDILPAAAGKGAALAWLLRELGVRMSQVIVAGDTGNDREMLELSGVRGIVLPGEESDLDHLDANRDRTRPRARAASGVIEALHAFGVFSSGALAIESPSRTRFTAQAARQRTDTVAA